MKIFNDYRFGIVKLPEIIKAHASRMATGLYYINCGRN